MTTTTTIEPAGANLVSKQTSVNPADSNIVGFDEYNNRTDVWEYDFGSPGQVGQLLRHTHTEYIKTASINGTPYDFACAYSTSYGQSAVAANVIHIRNLPQSVEVTDGLTSKVVARNEFLYDADGVKTVFVYNVGGQMVAEYSTNGSAGHGTNYLTSDTLGTPRIITGSDINDINGGVKARHDYLPFGEEVFVGRGGSYPGDSVRQKFTRYERDNESGLDYAQARYYANVQGRFTSADPLLASGRPADPQTWNRYVYCRNNPLNYIDPSGLDWWYDSEAKEASPQWYDKDPGGKWKRWTDVSGYVYQDASNPGIWIALNPNKQEGLMTNSRETAQAAEDGYTGSGIGLSMTHAQQDFWAGIGAGLGGPAGWLLGKIAGAGGVDTTSRDYRAGLLFGSAGFAGATTVGNIGSSLADDAAGVTPQIIYRSGKTNPGNLTDPRGLSFRDSLSNPYPLAPGQRPVFGHGDSYFGVNTAYLPRRSVMFDNIPPGHVTVTGVTPAILKDAATQTGIRGNFPK